MLTWLLYGLRELIPAFNVFRYITFRVVAAMIAALTLSWILGPWFIRQLRRLSVGQNIREVGPQAHLVKAGTPTMGGLLILFATLVPTLLFAVIIVFLALALLVAQAFEAQFAFMRSLMQVVDVSLRRRSGEGLPHSFVGDELSPISQQTQVRVRSQIRCRFVRLRFVDADLSRAQRRVGHLEFFPNLLPGQRFLRKTALRR